MGGRHIAFAAVAACAGCTLLSGAGDLEVAAADAPDVISPELDAAGGIDAPSDGPPADVVANGPHLGAGEARVYAASGTSISSRTVTASATWNVVAPEFTVAGTPSFIVPVLSADGREEIVGVQHTSFGATSIAMRRRAASGWVTDFDVAAFASANRRVFDLDMNAAGEALFVHEAAGGGAPRYRFRANGAWSADAAVPTGTLVGTPVWIDLVRRPGTNEVTLGIATSAAELYVITWTGTQWNAATFQSLEGELNTIDFQSFLFAYEGVSGDLLAIWGRDQPAGAPFITPWRVRPAGQNQFGVEQTVAATPSAAMAFANEPGTDRIAFVWNEDTCGASACDDFFGAIWNGTAFVNVTIIDGDIGSGWKARVGTKPVGVTWRSGEAIAVYTSTNPSTTNLRWVRWTGAAGWSSVQTATMSPGIGEPTVFFLGPSTVPNVTALLVASTTGIYARVYDGLAWQNGGLDGSLFATTVTSGVPVGVVAR